MNLVGNIRNKAGAGSATGGAVGYGSIIGDFLKGNEKVPGGGAAKVLKEVLDLLHKGMAVLCP